MLDTQIARLDLYSQSFGNAVQAKGSAYMDFAEELIKRQDEV